MSKSKNDFHVDTFGSWARNRGCAPVGAGGTKPAGCEKQKEKKRKMKK